MSNDNNNHGEQNIRGERILHTENIIIHKLDIGKNVVHIAGVQQSTNSNFNPKTNDNKKRATKRKSVKEAVRKTLRHLYQRVAMSNLPFRENEDIPMKYFTKLQLELEGEDSKNKIIDLHDLFNTVNKKNPRRIAIESQLGFGKTTVGHKLISDWYNEVEYVCTRFKFAFLIVLTHATSRTLKEELLEIISGENRDEDEMWRIINTEKTLLVLDELNEVGENMRNDITEILCDTKNEYKMTIVTTCRTGQSRLKKEEVESRFRGLSVKKEFWCKKITILGIADENQDEFLRNFVDDDGKDQMMPRLLEIVQSRREMFRSPSMLILLIYIMRENHEIKIKTNTDLYKQFADYIIKRSIAKTNPEKANANFTLFDSSMNEYSSLFYTLGEMSWENILNDNVHFNANAETEAIHQLGFLLKHEKRNALERIVYYKGFHHSFLEFAASVFLQKQFHSNQNRFCDNVIEQIVNTCIKKNSFSLVVPFLSSLLGNDVASFFGQLSNYDVKCHITEKLIESILRECEMTTSMCEYFTKIVPTKFEVREVSAVLAVANQYSRSCLDVLAIDIWFFTKIITPMYIRILRCYTRDNSIISYKEVLKGAENINCESLIFELNCDLSYDKLTELLKIFITISSDRKILRLKNVNPNAHVHLEKCVSDGMLAGLQFELHAEIFNGSGLMDSIAKIVEHNEITHFTIDIHDRNAIYASDMLRSLAEINGLNSWCINRVLQEVINPDCGESTDSTGEKLDFLDVCNIHDFNADTSQEININSNINRSIYREIVNFVSNVLPNLNLLDSFEILLSLNQ